MSNNRTCKICGKAYHYCPTCPADKDKPAWMTRFDSSKCKELWDVLVANGAGEITDSETVQKLNQIDYKSLNIENEGIREHITRLTGNTLPTPLSKKEIKEAITSTDATSKTEASVKKPAPTPEVKEAISSAADSISKKNGFKFLNK